MRKYAISTPIISSCQIGRGTGVCSLRAPPRLVPIALFSLTYKTRELFVNVLNFTYRLVSANTIGHDDMGFIGEARSVGLGAYRLRGLRNARRPFAGFRMLGFGMVLRCRPGSPSRLRHDFHQGPPGCRKAVHRLAREIPQADHREWIQYLNGMARRLHI